MKLNLRNKFLIPTLGLVVLGIGISTVVSYVKSKSALEDVIKTNMAQFANLSGNQLSSWVSDIKDEMKRWSEMDTFQSNLELVKSGNTSFVNDMNKQLATLKEQGKCFESLAITNPSGEVVFKSDSSSGASRVADKEFFKSAARGQSYVSDAVKSDSTSNAVFMVSCPIFSVEFGGKRTSEVVGVIYGVVNIDYFASSYLNKISLGKTSFNYIVNKEGVCVSYPDKSKIFALDLKNYDWGKKMTQDKEGTMTYTINGEDRFVGFKTSSDTGWITAIAIASSEVLAPVNKIGLWIIIIGIGIMAVLAIGMWVTTDVLIIRPIAGVAAALKDIAQGEGDLTVRLPVKSDDEVGELSKWFNIFMDKLHSIIKDIGGNADTLTTSSTDLSGLSGKMSEGADHMSSKANTVATAAEEMSTNINSIAAAMEEASTNMGLVATAAEQMTATINEIARNSENARSITGSAVSKASDATTKIDELGKGAQEIGKVTETITEISEQTNLLALNATIEAARAGEAGKGFAVVANEIKELARQTAEATQDIKDRINKIQSSTSGAVTQVEGISKVINDVNEIVSTIATAVEEQSVTTKEIAGNVSQASGGIQEVSENIAQLSTVAGEIARDISDVNQSSNDMSNSSSHVDMRSQELSKLAVQLKDMVGKFKLK
jgi:methyl-accepting chemotaxis protein